MYGPTCISRFLASWLLLLTELVFHLLSLVNHLPDELAPVLEHKLQVDALPEVPVVAATSKSAPSAAGHRHLHLSQSAYGNLPPGRPLQGCQAAVRAKQLQSP